MIPIGAAAITCAAMPLGQVSISAAGFDAAMRRSSTKSAIGCSSGPATSSLLNRVYWCHAAGTARARVNRARSSSGKTTSGLGFFTRVLIPQAFMMGDGAGADLQILQVFKPRGSNTVATYLRSEQACARCPAIAHRLPHNCHSASTASQYAQAFEQSRVLS